MERGSIGRKLLEKKIGWEESRGRVTRHVGVDRDLASVRSPIESAFGPMHAALCFVFLYFILFFLSHGCVPEI